MNQTRFLPGLALMAALSASSAFGQVQRTFVSGLGSDGNPCSLTAPCRTFAQALSQTNAGGEVYVLDSAGYGPFTVNRSVSVVAPLGVTAGISVFSGNGISITAGGSDIVILRGLTVNSQGTLGSGVVFNSGGTLHVESCVINGFVDGAALLFQGAGTLVVKDSVMRSNLNAITVHPFSGTAVASIDHVRLEANRGDGVAAREGAQVTVRNSVASANFDGFVAVSGTAASPELNLEACVASNNSSFGIGVRSASTGVATVRLSNCTVTDNPIGLLSLGAPALLLSRGNNTVEGNAIDTSGPIGSYTAK